MSDTSQSDIDREWAEAEYQFYKKHGRPSSPYYMKCMQCGEAYEIEGTLYGADHDARYHAGYHGGLREEHAEVVVTDSTGRELFRHHALHNPDSFPEHCEECGSEKTEGQVTCSECGFVPEQHRVPMTDGGHADRRDLEDDPRACSVCGVHIGFGGDDYCDGCAREIGAKPPLRRCEHCGTRGPEEYMKPIDISTEDEYYPEFIYICRGCANGGESGD